MTARAKIIAFEKKLRDERLNGVVAARHRVAELDRRLEALEVFVREEITGERLAEVCGVVEESGERVGMRPEIIVLHHSATQDGPTVSWGAIRRYHVEQRGWKDIGYHFGIELLHLDYEVVLGRMPTEPGAHCLGWNFRSLGICCVGNFDAYGPDPGMWATALKLVRSLMGIYGIERARVIGHREAAQDGRSCPGRLFDLEKFRGEL